MKTPRQSSTSYGRSVFINCPFDDAYVPLLRPLLYTVLDLGFSPRIATERSNSGENRIDKIVTLMRESRFSIHDISRMKSAAEGEFARFNLPFELGIDRGAQLFGTIRLRKKRCLILDAQPFDYRRALSDLSGVDIKHHLDDPSKIVRAVRNWFVETAGLTGASSATSIWYGFTEFASAFYDDRKKEGFSDDDLNFMPVPEYIRAIRNWHVTSAPPRT